MTAGSLVATTELRELRANIERRVQVTREETKNGRPTRLT